MIGLFSMEKTSIGFETMTTLQTPGDRLRDARDLTGLMRTAFCRKHGLNIHSMNAWETNLSKFSEKSAQKICDALLREGVDTSVSWIMDGLGEKPVHTPTSRQLEYGSAQEESEIWREMARFKHYYPDALTMTLTDDSCLPLYRPGDFLGGVAGALTLESLVGQLCLMNLDNDCKVIRIIESVGGENTVTARCLNEHSQIIHQKSDTFKIQSAAPITWFRRRVY
jgi:transcriptional regulator with XRE-family HTH domain